MGQTTQEIFTDLIDDPQFSMRSEMDRTALFELADNIKQNGLINPITVRPIGGRFEVVAGHRRLAAVRIAGIIKIPSVVRELDDEQVFNIMTAENLERLDVPLLDECRHYKTAIERFGKGVKEVAFAARRSEAYIRARLAIADMPEYLQTYLQKGDITLGVALILCEILDENVRRAWIDMAVRDGISIAQAEYWLHGWKVNQLPGGTPSSAPPSGEGVSPARTALIECVVDGKKYDARLFRAVLVYEGNYEILLTVLEELRRVPQEISSSPADGLVSPPPLGGGGGGSPASAPS